MANHLQAFREVGALATRRKYLLNRPVAIFRMG